MTFAWLKHWMPRSLYGRAALILLVPVVTLQLVVSVVFIQRHFDGVTRQMTRSIVLELRYLTALVQDAPNLSTARAALQATAGPLGYAARLPDPGAEADSRLFYDFSGLRVIETVREGVLGVIALDLATSTRDVELWVDTRHGVLHLNFDRRRVSASNPHQLLVLMVFTGILLTLIAFVFLRNQLRPIMRLAAAAEEFGKGRHAPYKPSGAVEVRAAGNAFLDMRARIERQIEQRTMMLSGISHDLRTPLTRLKLGLSMQPEDPEIQAMQKDVADMERLVEEFLSFARGEMLDDPVPADPVALIEDVVTRTGDPAVQLVEVSGRGEVLLRPMAVTRALDNLIGNALRYGTRCDLRLAISERAVRISVEDNGPGIAPERREEAMKPFSRLDAARNQDRGGGVGLGLAIAHDIARRHGGTLVLGESAGLGGLKADLVLAR